VSKQCVTISLFSQKFVCMFACNVEHYNKTDWLAESENSLLVIPEPLYWNLMLNWFYAPFVLAITFPNIRINVMKLMSENSVILFL
jgi:hypothetical protein